MKTLVFAILAAVLMTGESVARERKVYRKHYVTYVEGQPYYNVYYVDQQRRPYYRRVYYEDEPEYVTYRSTKRYYYHTRRHDDISVHLGF